MTTEAIPKLLFVNQDTEELIDKRFGRQQLIEEDQKKQLIKKWSYKFKSEIHLQSSFEIDDKDSQSTSIFQSVYSNKLGKLFYNSRQGIVIYDIEELNTIVQSGKISDTKVYISQRGSMFLSPQQKRLLVLNEKQIHIFSLQSALTLISTTANSDGLTNACWENQDWVFLWSFERKLFSFEIAKGKLNEISGVQKCTGVNRLGKTRMVVLEGVHLYVFEQRIKSKSVDLSDLNPDEPLFQFMCLIGISKINNLDKEQLEKDDIYVLIGVYYTEYAEDDDTPCNRNAFFMRGDLFSDVQVRGSELIFSINNDQSLYLAKDKTTRYPFSCIFSVQHNFTVVLVEKMESLFFVDSTEKFEKLGLFSTWPKHGYKISSSLNESNKFLRAMTTMKNMLPFEKEPASDKISKLYCNNQFSGQFFRLYFAHKQSDLTIEFPVSIICFSHQYMFRKYAACTIKNCEQDKDEQILKFIKEVKKSRYVEPVERKLKVEPIKLVQLQKVPMAESPYSHNESNSLNKSLQIETLIARKNQMPLSGSQSQGLQKQVKPLNVLFQPRTSPDKKQIQQVQQKKIQVLKPAENKQSNENDQEELQVPTDKSFLFKPLQIKINQNTMFNNPNPFKGEGILKIQPKSDVPKAQTNQLKSRNLFGLPSIGVFGSTPPFSNLGLGKSIEPHFDKTFGKNRTVEDKPASKEPVSSQPSFIGLFNSGNSKNVTKTFDSTEFKTTFDMPFGLSEGQKKNPSLSLNPISSHEAPKPLSQSESIKKVSVSQEQIKNQLKAKMEFFTKQNQALKDKIELYLSDQKTPQLFNLKNAKDLVRNWNKMFESPYDQSFDQIGQVMRKMDKFQKFKNARVRKVQNQEKEIKQIGKSSKSADQLVESLCYFVSFFQASWSKASKESIFGPVLKKQQKDMKKQEQKFIGNLSRKVKELQKLSETLKYKLKHELVEELKSTKKEKSSVKQYKFDTYSASSSEDSLYEQDETSSILKKFYLEKQKRNQEEQLWRRLSQNYCSVKDIEQSLERHSQAIIFNQRLKPLYNFSVLQEIPAQKQQTRGKIEESNKKMGSQPIQPKPFDSKLGAMGIKRQETRIIPNLQNIEITKQKSLVQSEKTVSDSEDDVPIVPSRTISKLPIIADSKSSIEASASGVSGFFGPSKKKQEVKLVQNAGKKVSDPSNSFGLFKEPTNFAPLATLTEGGKKQLASPPSIFGTQNTAFSSQNLLASTHETKPKLNLVVFKLKDEGVNSKQSQVKPVSKLPESTKTSESQHSGLSTKFTISQNPDNKGVEDTKNQALKSPTMSIQDPISAPQKSQETTFKTSLNPFGGFGNTKEAQKKLFEVPEQRTSEKNADSPLSKSDNPKPLEPFLEQSSTPPARPQPVNPSSDEQRVASQNSQPLQAPIQQGSEGSKGPTTGQPNIFSKLSQPSNPPANPFPQPSPNVPGGMLNQNQFSSHASTTFGGGNRFLNNPAPSQPQPQTGFNPNTMKFGASTGGSGLKTFANIGSAVSNPFNQTQQPTQSWISSGQAQGWAGQQSSSWALPQSTGWLQSNPANMGVQPWSPQNNSWTGHQGMSSFQPTAPMQAPSGINPSLMQPRK